MTEKAEKIELGIAQPPVKSKAKRGPGRPRKSTTQRIRTLLDAGASTKHITEKLGVSAQQVYQVRYDIKKQTLASKNVRVIKKSPNLGAPYEFAPAPVKNEGARIPYVYTAPKPTFWQRVKAVFFPN